MLKKTKYMLQKNNISFLKNIKIVNLKKHWKKAVKYWKVKKKYFMSKHIYQNIILKNMNFVYNF